MFELKSTANHFNEIVSIIDKFIRNNLQQQQQQFDVQQFIDYLINTIAENNPNIVHRLRDFLYNQHSAFQAKFQIDPNHIGDLLKILLYIYKGIFLMPPCMCKRTSSRIHDDSNGGVEYFTFFTQSFLPICKITKDVTPAVYRKVIDQFNEHLSIMPICHVKLFMALLTHLLRLHHNGIDLNTLIQFWVYSLQPDNFYDFSVPMTTTTTTTTITTTTTLRDYYYSSNNCPATTGFPKYTLFSLISFISLFLVSGYAFVFVSLFVRLSMCFFYYQ